MNLFSISPSIFRPRPQTKVHYGSADDEGMVLLIRERRRNEGGVAEAFCGATRRSLRRGERLQTLLHTHTSHFHSAENANGLKHIHTSCSILITQILSHLTQTRDCFPCCRVTSAGFLARVQMNVCKLKVKLRLSLTLQ